MWVHTHGCIINSMQFYHMYVHVTTTTVKIHNCFIITRTVPAPCLHSCSSSLCISRTPSKHQFMLHLYNFVSKNFSINCYMSYKMLHKCNILSLTFSTQHNLRSNQVAGYINSSFLLSLILFIYVHNN